MRTDEQLAELQAAFGSPRKFRIGLAIVIWLLVAAAAAPEEIGDGLGVLALVPAVLTGIGFWVRLNSAGYRHMAIYPVSDFGLYMRAVWWFGYWPRPDAARSDWLLFTFQMVGFGAFLPLAGIG